MLPAGLVKASPAPATPPYYFAWCDAFVAVDFERITLPLLFSGEDVYKAYFSTMRKMHSRKVSEWDRMGVHYARAQKCYKNGQFVECINALQNACLLRRDVFVPDDYQVSAAYEHAAWAAVHLALIRIADTDGKRIDNNHPDHSHSAATDVEDDDEESNSELDSDDARERSQLDMSNPNEIPRLFTIAEQLLKDSAARTRRMPFTRGLSHSRSSSTSAGNATVGGGVLKAGGGGQPSSNGAMVFPNRVLLEFVLFHNCANYWVRRKKWKAARKYTSLAEARFRSLAQRGLVMSDDVVPSLVCGVTAVETFMRCRSELVRLRSQFVGGSALGGGESLLYQKPINNNPRAVGVNLSSSTFANSNNTGTASLGSTFNSSFAGGNSTTGGADSFLSGLSFGASSGASTASGGNAGLVCVTVPQSLALSHEPLVNSRLLPATLCGEGVALASELEELRGHRVSDFADADKCAAEKSSAYKESVAAENHSASINPQSVLTGAIIQWLRIDKNTAVSESVVSAAMMTVQQEENVGNKERTIFSESGVESECKENGSSAKTNRARVSEVYPYLNLYPHDVPLSAVISFIEKDVSFRHLKKERSMYERLLRDEKCRQEEEQRTFDELAAANEAYNALVTERQRAMDDGQQATSLPPRPAALPAAPNKTANTNSLLRFEESLRQCTAAMDARCAEVAERALERDGLLKVKVWCSPSGAPPPSVLPSVPFGGSAPSSAAPTPVATKNGSSASPTVEGAEGVWCDVAMSFVAARREFSAPDSWCSLAHTVPFYYHYVAAVLAFNDRKFSLALSHLDRCARLVLASGEEGAALSQLQSERREEIAAVSEESTAVTGSSTAASQACGVLDGATLVDINLEVNPFWWERGVVSLRQNCVEGPSHDYYSKFTATRKAMHSPIETLQRHIMHEHVISEQARKRRLLQEEVLRSRLLVEEDGDVSVVDAPDPVTGRPSWALEPSIAETNTLVNELASYSDTLRVWRDRRGLPFSRAGGAGFGTEASVPNGEADDNETTCVSERQNPPSTSPANEPPVKISSSARAASNPSSETLQKLTFAQKQAQGKGGAVVSNGTLNTSSNRGGGAPVGSLKPSGVRRRLPQPLPMLREVAIDALAASKLRRQETLKRRSGSAEGEDLNDNDASVHTARSKANPSPAPAANDPCLSADANSTSSVGHLPHANSPENIFLAVHNVLVDALIARQEVMMARSAARRRRAAARCATQNAASSDMPAPSEALKNGDGVNEVKGPNDNRPSSALSDPPSPANRKHRRASLLVLEEHFANESQQARQSLSLRGRGGSETRMPADPPFVADSSQKATSTPQNEGRVATIAPRSLPLLSLYDEGKEGHSRQGNLNGADVLLPPLNKSPLRIDMVGIPTEEAMNEATLFGMTPSRRKTTPFGDVKVSALLATSHLPVSGSTPGIQRSPYPNPNRGIPLSPSPMANSSVAVSTASASATPSNSNTLGAGGASGAPNRPPTGVRSVYAGSREGAFSGRPQFTIDPDLGAVVGTKRFNLVPHIEGIAEKQHALRAMLPSVDFRGQKDLYRTIMAEIAENEEILRLRRVEMQQRVLRHEADKLRILAAQQQQSHIAVAEEADAL